MIAENAVLGSIIKAPYLIKDTDIQPDHLTNQANRNILTTMRNLDSAGKSIDIVSLLTAGNPNSFGGAGYLQQIQAAANVDKFDDHIEIVLDGWRNREKQNVLQIASQEDWQIPQITGELDKLTNNRTTDQHRIKDMVVDVYEAPWQKVEKSPGAPTGLIPVDRITGGWQDSDLIILAARPSMGKTDVMLHFAKEAGWHERLPIVFSLEMPAERLRDRLLASIGRYDRGKFKNLERFMTEEEKNRWHQTTGQTNSLAIAFNPLLISPTCKCMFPPMCSAGFISVR